jgi:hypothetical protein
VYFFFFLFSGRRRRRYQIEVKRTTGGKKNEINIKRRNNGPDRRGERGIKEEIVKTKTEKNVAYFTVRDAARGPLLLFPPPTPRVLPVLLR